MSTYMDNYYNQLVGKTITKVIIEQGSEEEFGEPVYGFILNDGSIFWLLRDPEGNGPGFLEISGGGK